MPFTNHKIARRSDKPPVVKGRVSQQEHFHVFCIRPFLLVEILPCFVEGLDSDLSVDFAFIERF